MNLYAISEELNLIENQMMEWAAENDGDITNFPLSKTLEVMEGELKEKLLSWGVWYKNTNSESKALDTEIKNLQSRKKSLDNLCDRIKNTIDAAMPEDTLKNSKCVLSYRKSKSVSCVLDELPKEFKKISESADKTELSKALKAGQEIKGAEMVTKKNLQIK